MIASRNNTSGRGLCGPRYAISSQRCPRRVSELVGGAGGTGAARSGNGHVHRAGSCRRDCRDRTIIGDGKADCCHPRAKIYSSRCGETAAGDGHRSASGRGSAVRADGAHGRTGNNRRRVSELDGGARGAGAASGGHGHVDCSGALRRGDGRDRGVGDHGIAGCCCGAEVDDGRSGEVGAGDGHRSASGRGSAVRADGAHGRTSGDGHRLAPRHGSAVRADAGHSRGTPINMRYFPEVLAGIGHADEQLGLHHPEQAADHQQRSCLHPNSSLSLAETLIQHLSEHLR